MKLGRSLFYHGSVDTMLERKELNMVEFPSIEDLRDYLLYRLCRQADLVFEAPLAEEPIFRNGRKCGISFVLFGPLKIRLSAIWDLDAGKLLLYDENMKKFDVVEIQVDGVSEKVVASSTTTI